MKKTFAFIVMFCMLLSTFMMISSTVKASAAVQTTFYVSPTGSDVNPGSQAQPFQTIGQAQTAVRAINSNMTGDIVVILMDGTYNLTSTLTFTSLDSGTNGFNVIYRADTASTPVISGGTSITGWTLDDAAKNIYKANVGTSLQTRQLYVDGVRAVRARGDNLSGFTKTSIGYTLPSTGTYANMASWGNVSDIEVAAKGYPWQQSRLGIASISGSAVTMKQPGWSYAPSNTGTNGWVENAYELLDTAGEWYLNRTTGYMYYIPRTGENMSTSSFIAGTLETLISGAGTLDAPVHNIQFDGITFTYNTWLMPNTNAGYPDNQGGVIIIESTDPEPENHKMLTPAGVAFKAAKSITVKNCTFTHIGNAGLGFDRGSQNNVIDHNTFTDLSGSGITLGNILVDDNHPTDSRNITSNNNITNNTISNIGVEYFDTVGIFGGYTVGAKIQHNTLYNLPYSGISWGWGWGYHDTLGTPVSQNNIISHNLIHDIMQTMNDGGGIYTLGSQQGSKVYNNYIYAIKNLYAHLYRDNGTSGYFDTNNVISSLDSTNSWWYYTNTGSGGYWNANNNKSYYNYFSSDLILHGTGGTNAVGNNYSVTNYAWDATAQAIIANAGVDGGDGPAPNFNLPAAPPALPSIPQSQITATATSYHAGAEPSKALDGSTASIWHSEWSPMANLPQSITLNLGGTYNVDKLRYLPRTDASSNGNITAYNIYTSTDGMNFTKVANAGTWVDDNTEKSAAFAPTNAAFIRLEATAGHGGFACAAEINVELTPSTVPQSQISATATSNFAGSEPSKAIDGSSSTMWHTAFNGSTGVPTVSLPQSITLNLGATYNVAQLRYLPRQDASLNGNITSYNIYTSTDGTNFTKIVNGGTWADDANPKAMSFTPVNASYVKLEAIAAHGGFASAAEINIDTLGNPITFTPPATSNLKLWLKADTGVVADVNGKVSSWSDQSGVANHSVQATSGYQPTLVSNVVNGNPVIRFDGVNDNLLSSGVTGSMNTSTVIFVLKPQAVTNYNQSIGAAGGWGQFQFHTTSTGQVYVGTSASSRITPTDGPGANTLVANTWSKFAYVLNNGSAKLFKNGVQLASKTISNPASWTGFTLGNNGSNTINGDIAEVIVYNSALSDTDRQSIETYLQTKYGF
ncbi:discoidin domain-containing protein [Paenibacillus sp. Soil787]|uniref:discoidin domain-containing protein n=1 Tax=Paenibacillus sp. Soil787 TaxID=1736411 RepID=UPI0006FE98D9|nr:discoidin domain-containing protein [Paenibacillus sp. Soil787]KRF44162.1 hypothetical protein ASG93_04445 [Paenibacillus sp. Soil787]